MEHEVEPSRLALFCDAYVGVVATLLYLPLMSLLEDEVMFSVSSFIKERKEKKRKEREKRNSNFFFF